MIIIHQHCVSSKRETINKSNSNRILYNYVVISGSGLLDAGFDISNVPPPPPPPTINLCIERYRIPVYDSSVACGFWFRHSFPRLSRTTATNLMGQVYSRTKSSIFHSFSVFVGVTARGAAKCPTLINGFTISSFQIWWTALSLALGFDLQGDIVRGVPCVKRNHQLFCPSAGNTYPM